MKVAFLDGVATESHVQPLAAALAGARSGCFGKDVALGTVAIVQLKLHAKTIGVRSHNPGAACLARAIDGKPIDDSSDIDVELQVSIAASR